jgi:hypothetical protein
MNLLWLNLAALAVVVVYGVYRAHLGTVQRKQRQVRERVAFMLWVAAHRGDHRQTSLVGP